MHWRPTCPRRGSELSGAPDGSPSAPGRERGTGGSARRGRRYRPPGHFSGRASELPGWGLVSTYNGGYPADQTWMDDVIFAIELKPNGRVVRLAHTQSLYDENVEQDYWAEPHVSVNHNFTRVIFTSNWGRTGTEEVDMYMILLPDHWIETLP